MEARARRTYLIAHIAALCVWCITFLPPLVAMARGFDGWNGSPTWGMWILPVMWPFSYLVCFLIVRFLSEQYESSAFLAILFLQQMSAVLFVWFALRSIL